MEDDSLVGTVIDDRYEVERLIARGGFSSVYRGRLLEDDRAVALKVLTLGPDVEATWIERFTREAKIVSELESPNTVRIYGWGQVGTEFLYTAMEYIAGRSLFRQVRRHGALNSTQVAEVAIQICNSLTEVHERGYLHRDLKPSNIMLYRNDEGHVVVKVLDFGVVKILEPGPEFSLQLTQQGTFIGTPRYAAPEQLRREPLTTAADVYGVGMIMWEALTGDPAVGDNDYSQAVKAHLDSTPWKIPDWVVCPPDFGAIVEKALAKPVDRRYQSCDELKTALHDWLMSRNPGSQRESPDENRPVERQRSEEVSAPSNGGRNMAKDDDHYQPETLQDVEAEDELFGEIVDESDAHIEDVNVMSASDLSEASDANRDRSHITVAKQRKSDHAGIEAEDRPVSKPVKSSGGSNTLLTVLLLVAAIAGGLYVFTMGDDGSTTPTTSKTDETAATTKPDETTETDEAKEKKEVAPDSEMGDGTPTLDASTIMKGMVASGWKLGAKSTDKMDEVLQTTLVATKGGSAASVTIYESETWDWAEELEKKTEPPTKAVSFGRTVVRIAGGPDDKANGSIEMNQTLWDFRKHARARARGESTEEPKEEPAEEGKEEAPSE